MATWFELGTDGPTKILVGVDGSDTSLHAGAYAAGMARRQGSRIIALYVAPTGGMAAGMAATAGALMQTHDGIATGAAGPDRRGLPSGFGVHVSSCGGAGNPYLELVRVAEELRVDAIVVGASMQSGHRLVGSLAGRLVRDAKWPITVVP